MAGQVPTALTAPAPSQPLAPREQPQPCAAIPETQIQGMLSGMKGETEVSFSVLHSLALKFLHITFDLKPHKVYMFFLLRYKGRLSVILGMGKGKETMLSLQKNKQDASADKVEI